MPHCHLITDQAACCQCTSVFATWDIIRQYADWPDKTLDDMMQLIDTLANGFMLPHPCPAHSHICTGTLHMHRDQCHQDPMPVHAVVRLIHRVPPGEHH